MAYRSLRTKRPIEVFLPKIIQAFKATVFRYKQNRIKTSFTPYFYGTASAMLVKERYKLRGEEVDVGSWIAGSSGRSSGTVLALPL